MYAQILIFARTVRIRAWINYELCKRDYGIGFPYPENLNGTLFIKYLLDL